MRRLPTSFFALFCAGSLAVVSLPVLASGGGEESPPEFNSPWGPVRPLADLATGSLGVVEASWWRKPLLLSWYRFNGQTLPAGVLDTFAYRAQAGSGYAGSTAMTAWQAEAKAASGGAEPASVASDTALITGNNWDQFENCPNDAWEQARRTLVERTKVWGADSPALHNWLEGQNRVFARCPLGPGYFRTDLPGSGQINPLYAQQFLLPDMGLTDPPAGSPPLLVKDRTYQRAAALLYEGHYAEAEAAFTAIARDAASPWQEWGMYLALRARLRHIQMVAPAPTANDYTCHAPQCVERRLKVLALRASEASRLREDIAKAILAARQAGRQDELRRLDDLEALTSARLDPATRFKELAAVLAKPEGDAAGFRRAATDYLLLHRQFPPSEPLGEWLAGMVNGYDPTYTPCPAGETAAQPRSPYPDSTEIECRRLQWSQESLRRFDQAQAQYAWLFSAAALANRDDPHVGKLLTVLAKVPEDHPGATTFMLQRLRLGGREEGLRLAAALSERADVQRDYSARNRVREYRLWLATSLADFWKDAMREHGTPFDRDTLLSAAPANPNLERAAPVDPNLGSGWDYDTAWILNYELPHSALIETARNTEVHEYLRKLAADMAWSRAILRQDAAAARQALAVASLPAGIAHLPAIVDDRTLLLEGGLMIHGMARTGGTCHMSAPKADAYTPDYEEVVGNLKAHHGRFAKNMLSPEGYAEWQRERQVFEELPDLDSVWMENVLVFAKAFPGDPRVPGLLRDAVYRTRRNWCADPSAGQLSKEAFDLLKRKYPKSNEARGTKYWFNPRT